jgi:hypothetical protein
MNDPAENSLDNFLMGSSFSMPLQSSGIGDGSESTIKNHGEPVKSDDADKVGDDKQPMRETAALEVIETAQTGQEMSLHASR